MEELRREPSWPPMLAAESRRGRWSFEDSMLSARKRVPSWRAKPSSAYETELTLCSRPPVRALCSLIRVVDTATGTGARLAVLEVALAALSARARARNWDWRRSCSRRAQSPASLAACRSRRCSSRSSISRRRACRIWYSDSMSSSRRVSSSSAVSGNSITVSIPALSPSRAISRSDGFSVGL